MAPITKKAPAGKSGQSYLYPLPDGVFAENGLNFDDDALLEQVAVCDFLFEVNLQLPFETTFNLARASGRSLTYLLAVVLVISGILFF